MDFNSGYHGCRNITSYSFPTFRSWASLVVQLMNTESIGEIVFEEGRERYKGSHGGEFYSGRKKYKVTFKMY